MPSLALKVDTNSLTTCAIKKFKQQKFKAPPPSGCCVFKPHKGNRQARDFISCLFIAKFPPEILTQKTQLFPIRKYNLSASAAWLQTARLLTRFPKHAAVSFPEIEPISLSCLASKQSAHLFLNRYRKSNGPLLSAARIPSGSSPAIQHTQRQRPAFPRCSSSGTT